MSDQSNDRPDDPCPIHGDGPCPPPSTLAEILGPLLFGGPAPTSFLSALRPPLRIPFEGGITGSKANVHALSPQGLLLIEKGEQVPRMLRHLAKVIACVDPETGEVTIEKSNVPGLLTGPMVRAEHANDLMDALEQAWGIIANTPSSAMAGLYLTPPTLDALAEKGNEWGQAAVRFRERYHEILDRHLATRPEYVSPAVETDEILADPVAMEGIAEAEAEMAQGGFEAKVTIEHSKLDPAPTLSGDEVAARMEHGLPVEVLYRGEWTSAYHLLLDPGFLHGLIVAARVPEVVTTYRSTKVTSPGIVMGSTVALVDGQRFIIKRRKLMETPANESDRVTLYFEHEGGRTGFKRSYDPAQLVEVDSSTLI